MSCNRLALDSGALFEICQKQRMESFMSGITKNGPVPYGATFPVDNEALSGQLVFLFDGLIEYPNDADTFIAWCAVHAFPTDLRETMDQTISFLGSSSSASMPLSRESLLPILNCLSDGLASGRFTQVTAMLRGITDTIRFHTQIASDEELAISNITQFVDSIDENTIPVALRRASALDLITDVRHLLQRRSDEVLDTFKEYIVDILLAISGDPIVLSQLCDTNFKAVAFEVAINPDTFVDAARRFLVSSPNPMEALVGSVIVGELKDVPVYLEKFVGTFKSFDNVADFVALAAAAHVADSYGAFLATREDQECLALYARNRIVQKYIVELLTYKHVSPSVGNDLAIIYARWSPLMDARVIEVILETIVGNPINSLVADLSIGELTDERIGTATVNIRNHLSSIFTISDDFLGPTCAIQSSIRDATLQLCGATGPIRALFAHVDQLLVHVENETAQSATASFIKMACYREGLDVALGALSEARYGIAYGCFEGLSDAYLAVLKADKTDAVLAHPIFTQTGEGLYHCEPQLIATIRDCYSSSNIEPIVSAHSATVLSRQCTTICEYLQLSVSMYRVIGIGGSVVPSLGAPRPQFESETPIGALWAEVARGVSAALGSETITETVLHGNMGAKCYLLECGAMALQQPEYLAITTPAELFKVRSTLELVGGDLRTACPFLPPGSDANIARTKAINSKLLHIHTPFF